MKALALLLIANVAFAATALEDTRESVRLLELGQVAQAKEKMEFVKADLEKADANKLTVRRYVDTFTAHPTHTCHVAILEAMGWCSNNYRPIIMNFTTSKNERGCSAEVLCTVRPNN